MFENHCDTPSFDAEHILFGVKDSVYLSYKQCLGNLEANGSLSFYTNTAI
jgi:hypothetical protein